MLAIVVSRADSASVHIGEHLLDIAEWEAVEDESRTDADGGGTVYRTDGAELREFEDLHLDLQRPADAFDDPDLLVFASRHSGETGPLLTAHHTGNFGPADHGGEADELARACPNAHAAAIDALERYAPDAYEVGMECTHHGPSDVGAPSMFVEVGSAEPQWKDPAAARAVAEAILDLRGVPADREAEHGDQLTAEGGHGGDETRRHLVGFGGGHYTPRFQRVLAETDWALGHIAADWGLDALGDLSGEGEAVLARAFEQSRAAYALVDGERPAVEEAVERAGYRAVGETWVRETDGVDLAFVRAVEDAVVTVEEGLRFGEPAASVEGTDFAVVSLPRELLDEARGIDREATWDGLAETALAFVTDQGGTRPTGPAVVAAAEDRNALVDALVAVLEQRYEAVERDGAAVLARTETFDPEKAKTLGVPEGPKFGRLAGGEAVEVGGRTIPPEQVRTEEQRRFPLE